MVRRKEQKLEDDQAQDLLVSFFFYNFIFVFVFYFCLFRSSKLFANLVLCLAFSLADIGRTYFDRDAFTTSSDFIISPHPAAKGLYVATCGSFHGFKFFPVLGKCVMQMLNGELTPELKQRWAWDRERPDYLKNPEYPNSDMRDLVDVVAKL